jgi:alkanesulfonate monooxygenase SsuD/methylene tetrahydromethanopterin reductase-like flavin-dependent oxidoreductase (luciferase family)
MWTGERGTEERFAGRHYTAERLLNSPQSLSRPRVPIMVGGGGERKTLRLVARYADGTNVFGGPDTLRHKYAVLREHCEAVGRPFEAIERSTLQSVRLSRDGRPGSETPEGAAERFTALATAGAQHVVVTIADLEGPGASDLAARLVSLVHSIPV